MNPQSAMWLALINWLYATGVSPSTKAAVAIACGRPAGSLLPATVLFVRKYTAVQGWFDISYCFWWETSSAGLPFALDTDAK